MTTNIQTVAASKSEVPKYTGLTVSAFVIIKPNNNSTDAPNDTIVFILIAFT